ncbi:MAG: hypothetical protein AB200_01420 [Parcubacteria bacterium C7867-005]|nr:MAG: hypothetical protein AB200_01420 [Parcubacteria bacterium C7867-005]
MVIHITKSDQENVRERIAVRVLAMHEGERVVHSAAVLEGRVDEACPECPKVFLAHECVGECGHTSCPFKMSEMERKQKYRQDIPSAQAPDQPTPRG